MKFTSLGLLAAGAIALAVTGPAAASDRKAKMDLGKREYMNSCAVCHGANGKVEGPEVAAVEFLKTMPTDLSTLAKRNGGVLPVDRLYAVIDGRQLVKGHGTRDMPIWGDRYNRETVKAAEYYMDMPYDMEMYVRSRVLALVDYINRLQVK
ncbi:MAG: cytochrome c [Rhodocyclaceae bacterium]|nr:cytochrome c [Rhodocyclaceae bacterium]